jgi:hypothetical protein
MTAIAKKDLCDAAQEVIRLAKLQVAKSDALLRGPNTAPYDGEGNCWVCCAVDDLYTCGELVLCGDCRYEARTGHPPPSPEPRRQMSGRRNLTLEEAVFEFKEVGGDLMLITPEHN